MASVSTGNSAQASFGKPALPDASTLQLPSDNPASALPLASDAFRGNDNPAANLPSAAASSEQQLRPADDVETMAEVKACIDSIDKRIVTLLGERMKYIEAAAEIQETREDVINQEKRKKEILKRATKRARRVEFPEDIVRKMFRILVDELQKKELEIFDRLEAEDAEDAEESDIEDGSYYDEDEDYEEDEEEEQRGRPGAPVPTPNNQGGSGQKKQEQNKNNGENKTNGEKKGGGG